MCYDSSPVVLTLPNVGKAFHGKSGVLGRNRKRYINDLSPSRG